jgi:hypothetical protein
VNCFGAKPIDQHWFGKLATKETEKEVWKKAFQLIL